MQDLTELQKSLVEAQWHYQTTMTKLKDPTEDTAFWAQKSNEAWLELKRITNEIENYETLKKKRDLYGC
jgi:hypothetical protein